MKKKVPGTYHHGNLPHCLIEAGKHELALKGITGLSLREVARAAGVSHTAVYRHFRDKADLLAAIAQDGFEALTATAARAAAESGDDPQAQFIAAAVQYVLFAVQHPQTAQLMFGGVIALLYAMLYVILRSEDHALLMGALLVFSTLAAVMFSTRNLDWYAVGEQMGALKKPQSGTEHVPSAS